MSVATARTFVLRCFVATVMVATGAFLAAGRAMAQGITSSGVRGLVSDEQGQPIAGATVLLTGTETGARFQAATQANGRYYMTNVIVGSYSIEARAIGYRPVRQVGLTLTVGQVAEVNLRMSAATIELTAITAQAGLETDVMSTSRTGASSTVTEEMVRSLPSLSRSFSDFIATVPQVVGTSISGQNNRYNNIQIDGSVNNDLFGLAGSGTPGGQANARPISVEAIKEFQVLIAPYDVKQSGFTGGLVNAVTRSGTNEWHGSLFGFWQGTNVLGMDLVGRDSLHNAVTDFSQRQWGIDISGPIVRDKLLFFANFEPQTRSAPFTGLVIGTDTSQIGAVVGSHADSVGIGIRLPTANRVAQIVRDSATAWGGPAYDPGDVFGPALQTPATNAFLKLTWQPGVNNTVEFSYNHVNGSTDVFGHSSTGAFTSTNSGYELSNAGYKQANVTNTARMIWTRPFGDRINNELILASQKISDHREIPAVFPLVFVGGDRGGYRVGADTFNIPLSTVPTNVSFGAERFSQGNSLDQNITEITDNLTLALGHGHTLTFGTHNELFKFHNVFFAGSYGVWSFRDTTALLTRSPYRYERLVPVQPSGSAVCATNPLICAAGATGNGPIADFNVNQLGGYVQDQWQPNSRLNVTFGVRVDVPNMNSPNYNLQLDTATIKAGPRVGQQLGINTSSSVSPVTGTPGTFPSSNALWSPRVGFNYDVNGDGTTLLRGGLGVFSGRPPYVWVSNSFVNTGLEQVDLVCDSTFGGATSAGGIHDRLPTYTADVSNQPAACAGPSTQASAAASVVYFDKNFKLPQTARLSLGMDHRLPWNMTLSVDAMFTQWLNSIYLTDVNLVPGGIAVGEGNRQLYIKDTTSLSRTGSAITSNRLTTQFRDIIKQSNSNQDYQYQLTIQLQKRFSNGLEFNAGYSYQRAYDLMSLTSSISNSNLRFAVLDGTLDNRNLRPSAFDVPHRVTFSVTGNLPVGFRGTLQYAGNSGTPYAYVTANDVNGDGLAGQDLVYVPLNAQDIQMCPLSGACTSLSQDPAAYAQLNAYINAEPCLASQRGQIMQRTSCRNPWQSFVNGRLAKTFMTLHGQSVELTADIFNVLSFLGIGGKVTSTSGFEETNLLTLNRYNPTAMRGVYTLATSLANLNRVDINASRWRMLLGLRYNI
jgi:hypothetical protein